jgi:hypothetical protein
MDAASKQDFIRRVARQNQADLVGSKILWSRHAITELANEGWSRGVAETALQTSEVIYEPSPEEWENDWRTRKR